MNGLALSWNRFWRQVLLSLTLSNLLIGGLITAWSIREQRRLLEDALEKRVKTISSNLANAAIVPLLLEDTQIMTQMTQDVVKEPDVIYAGILDADGKVFAEAWSRGQPLEHQPINLGTNYQEFAIAGEPFAEGDHPIESFQLGGSYPTKSARLGLARLIVTRKNIAQEISAISKSSVMVMGGLLLLAFSVTSYSIRKMTVRMNSLVHQLKVTEALRRSNLELERFAYVASHDLQEPLRKIEAFGDILREENKNLNFEERDYIERMQNAASRMRNLIDDLLAYSRVTSQTQPFSRVDLRRVVQEVLSDLEVRVKEVGGKIEVGRLPVIQADPTQMRQLFQNLIGNALKFHSTKHPPHIKISSSDHPENRNTEEVIIEDNGIGFDEKYANKIFLPFQRLHKRGEYEGTGIGLAICRKIVEHHDGEIKARSAPGKGSTFTVTLPKRVKEHQRAVAAA